MRTPAWNRRFNSVHDVTTSTGKHLAHERTAAREVFQPIADQAWLSGATGSDALAEVAERIDVAIGDLLAKRPAFRYLLGLRQLSPRLWTLAGPTGSDLQESTLNIAEIAVHRYADWAVPLDPAQTQTPIWSHGQTRSLARLLVLAEFYSNVSAARRRIGKGESVRFGADPGTYPFVPNPETAKVGRLITVLDERKRRSDNLVTGHGGYLPSERDGEQAERIIAAERLSPEAAGDHLAFIDDLIQLEPSGGPHKPLSAIQRDQARRALDFSCYWRFHPDLEPRRDVVREYDEACRSQFGFGLRDIEFVLDVCSSKVLCAWESFRFLDDFGLELAPAPTTDDFRIALEASRSNGQDPWPEVSCASANAALSFLDAGRHPGGLANPLSHRPIRIIGGTLLYDALHVRFPSPLLWQVDFNPASRKQLANHFEEAAHRELGGVGAQPWQSARKVRVHGREITDVDASVIVGELLVVVDCYNSRWSSELDIGAHDKTRNRESKLRAKLEKWDAKWKQLADYPELLPDGVRRVLPVVVTPSPEWLASDDPSLWFDDEVPRICTLAELIELLKSGNVLNHPSIVDVRGPGSAV